MTDQTQTTTEPVAWETAADSLCGEMLIQAPGQVRKVADALYEALLDTVQDYLRDNVAFNLSADLARAKRKESEANDALKALATAMDVDVAGFPNYPTPAMLSDLCIKKSTTPQPLAIGLDRERLVDLIDNDPAYMSNVMDENRIWLAKILADKILALAAPAEGDADVASALLWFGSQHNLELSYGYEVDGEGGDGWQVHSVNGGRNDREWTRLSFGHDTPIKAIAACLPAAPTGASKP